MCVCVCVCACVPVCMCLLHSYQVRPITAATLEKPDPAALHLAEDSDEDDKEEGRSWKR